MIFQTDILWLSHIILKILEQRKNWMVCSIYKSVQKKKKKKAWNVKSPCRSSTCLSCLIAVIEGPGRQAVVGAEFHFTVWIVILPLLVILSVCGTFHIDWRIRWALESTDKFQCSCTCTFCWYRLCLCMLCSILDEVFQHTLISLLSSVEANTLVGLLRKERDGSNWFCQHSL